MVVLLHAYIWVKPGKCVFLYVFRVFSFYCLRAHLKSRDSKCDLLSQSTSFIVASSFSMFSEGLKPNVLPARITRGTGFQCHSCIKSPDMTSMVLSPELGWPPRDNLNFSEWNFYIHASNLWIFEFLPMESFGSSKPVYMYSILKHQGLRQLPYLARCLEVGVDLIFGALFWAVDLCASFTRGRHRYTSTWTHISQVQLTNGHHINACIGECCNPKCEKFQWKSP